MLFRSIMFGKGISRSGDVLDLAVSIDVVKKSGSWYAYEGNKIGQGRENAKTYLEANPEIMEKIEKKVREHYSLEEDEKSGGTDELKLKPKGKSEEKGADKAKGKTVSGSASKAEEKTAAKAGTKEDAAEEGDVQE